MDFSAETDCEVIREALSAAGLSPVVLDDSAPGVPEGVFEVQVPAAESARADELIAARQLPSSVEKRERTKRIDFEAIYSSEGAQLAASVELAGIQNLLESNGIEVEVVGDSVLPNFPIELRVPRDQVEQAKALIAHAQTAGPAAAEEEERLTETGPASAT